MGKVNQNSLKNWNDGQTVGASDYKRERDLIIEANNDTHDRFLDVKLVADGVLEIIENNTPVVQQDEIPSGVIPGRLWLDTSDNEYQGTVFENLSSQLAQTVEQTISLNNPPIPLIAVKGDGVTDDSQSIMNIFHHAKQHKRSLELEHGNCFIGSPLVFDIANLYTFSFVMRGSFKAINGIGVMLTIKNNFGGRFDINIEGGGVSGDFGLVIENLVMPVINVKGKQFNGTVFHVSGTSQDNTKNVGVTVDVKTQDCGRAILHGQSNTLKHTDFFGTYSVIDRRSKQPSRFQNANDITIKSYENYFEQPSINSLEFDNCGALHLGIIAIGGRANNLIDFKNARGVTIDKLYMLGEDIEKGATERTTSGINIDSLSDVVINDINVSRLKHGVKHANGAVLEIKTYNVTGSTEIPILANNVNIEYPVGRRGSYMTTTEYVRQAVDYHSRQNFRQGFELFNGSTDKRSRLTHQSDDNVVFSVMDNNNAWKPVFTVKSGVSGEPVLTRLGGYIPISKSTDPTSVQTVPDTSPFNYTNNNEHPIQVIIQGGTVTNIQFVRGGVFTSTGMVNGCLWLAKGDRVQVQYTSKPTVVLAPM